MNVPAEAAPYLDQWLGPGWAAHPLAGDASVRAYYRITSADGRTYMLGWYPQEVRAQLQRVLAATEALAAHAPVPAVVQHCEVALLHFDAGDRTLFDVLHENREEGLRLYRAAIDLLAAFQRAPDRGLNAPFTSQFFFNELEMALEYFVEKLMGGESEPLRAVLRRLCENVARHPYRLCHRDFHGQNLHVFNDTLYLIDYQDLRMGPDTYDVASLLRDRGVGRILGDQAELELLDHYAEVAEVTADVRHRYFEALLQRSIKILGTFAKQPITRGRMHYLEFIHPTLQSIGRALDQLPEYDALRPHFAAFSFDPDLARQRAQNLYEAGR